MAPFGRARGVLIEHGSTHRLGASLRIVGIEPVDEMLRRTDHLAVGRQIAERQGRSRREGFEREQAKTFQARGKHQGGAVGQGVGHLASFACGLAVHSRVLRPRALRGLGVEAS